MSAVGWGVLSTAKINELVLAGATPSEEVDVVAVASRDDARATAYAAEHGIPRAHGSYEALLADPDVEAVYISLPNGLHVEWAIKALEAGKHVLCEKPLDRRPERVAEAFDAADAAGRLLTEAFMWRHNPQTARLVELLGEGVIGELRTIRAAFGFSLTDDTNVRMLADLDGGALMDVGCYCVSGARLVAGGEPEAVSGEAVLSQGGVDVRFAGVLRFACGVTATFDCGFDVAPNHALEIVGSDGSLYLADPWHARSPAIEIRRSGGTETVTIDPADSYRLELEDLSRAIRTGSTPLLGREDAMGQAATIAALYEAAAA